MHKRRLKNLTDIRRFLAATLNQLERGEVDETRAKTVAYCLNILSGIIRDGDLETRIKNLEEKLGGQK
ncbi:MAG: hypothetical protein SWC96_03945 [Thermodesulfobacteriota bacterium]|nr:hypothetical protein [Thermodesulfobacteriota bacterium]